MFINDLKYSSFIVNKMLGKNRKGYVGLYVNITTIGYFKDLKVTTKALKVKKEGEKANDIWGCCISNSQKLKPYPTPAPVIKPERANMP